MLETIVFDIFIKIMIYSSWIGIFLAPTTLLGLRIFHFFTDKTSIFKERLLTLLLPFSIGVELYVPNGRFKKVYHILLVVFFVFLLLSSFFSFYMLKTN